MMRIYMAQPGSPRRPRHLDVDKLCPTHLVPTNTQHVQAARYEICDMMLLHA
jgi:hypothetical protein